MYWLVNQRKDKAHVESELAEKELILILISVTMVILPILFLELEKGTLRTCSLLDAWNITFLILMTADAFSDLCHMEIYKVVAAAYGQEMQYISKPLLWCYQKHVLMPLIKMASCHGDSTIETGKIIIAY